MKLQSLQKPQKPQVYRPCIDCDKPFLVEYDTDWLCDSCSQRLIGTHTRLSFNMRLARNWDDKKIKQQWNNSYKKSESGLLSKCEGTNYYN